MSVLSLSQMTDMDKLGLSNQYRHSANNPTNIKHSSPGMPLRERTGLCNIKATHPARGKGLMHARIQICPHHINVEHKWLASPEQRIS